MKIWHISDTHGSHGRLHVPDVDMVIHSGDFTNARHKVPNSVELWPFLDWFQMLPIKHKVLVAGNHDAAVAHRMVYAEDIEKLGITYLENKYTTIEGLKIWGSPHTPTFGEWHFMMSRHKIGRVWDTMPTDADIVITHGPPQTVLDLTEAIEGGLVQVGCKSLLRRIWDVQPKLHCFGHVHSAKSINNAGTMKLPQLITTFSNASCVTDGKIGELSSNGNILEV
jgi:Icc-related predicted phosphoesterase